jgi:hypothetical protein
MKINVRHLKHTPIDYREVLSGGNGRATMYNTKGVLDSSQLQNVPDLNVLIHQEDVIRNKPQTRPGHIASLNNRLQ